MSWLHRHFQSIDGCSCPLCWYLRRLERPRMTRAMLETAEICVKHLSSPDRKIMYIETLVADFRVTPGQRKRLLQALEIFQ